MVLVVGLAALMLGADYRGCGASPGASDADEGVALPTGTGCVVDADCADVDMCSQMRCLAGSCSAVGLAVDRDGDGFAPAPCGLDCDDSDPNRFPEAAELCDAVDQDCDEVVDEDAIGVRAEALSDALGSSTMVAAGDALWVLGDVSMDTDVQLGLYPTDDPDALEMLPIHVELPRDAVGFADGRIVVVGPSGSAALSITELAPSADGYTVASQEDVGEPAELVALDVRRIGAEMFVMYDTLSSAGARRGLLHPVAGTIALTPDPEQAPPGLAFDGSRLVATSGRQGLQFLSSTGGLLEHRDLPGGFAHGALADGDGHVVAIYRDAFDHALTQMAVEGRSASFLAPSGEVGDFVSVHRIEEGVLVLRRQSLLIGGWVLSDDLSEYRARLPPEQLTFGGESIADLSVAVRSDGTAAILAHRPGEPDTVAFLTCETP